ncbi:sigma-E factor negative regulatory protein [Idiomarina xiamenensis]|uniref:Negative regulator of sigma E activity n=1 Tax=Idiomarina xiamenensis 10-D-4 TaxID=740709 RepID=K2L4Q7_9GAMM|nr:sigma-E factor negative regulatory protein [Idiomarina xiamenensis]EKE84810.1 negative regulator of sigma E activity [Idiomarina xiamenensis 10-D-4]
MSDKGLQYVSALLDNDVEDSQALAQLLADEAAQQQWQRYSLIGSVMRGESQPSQTLDISAQVSQAIAAGVGADDQPLPGQDDGEALQPDLRARSGALRRAAMRWMQPAAKLAVAASVAAVAVVSVQQLQTPEAGTAEEAMQPAWVTNPIGGRAPVSWNTVTTNQATDANQQRRQVQSFILDHQQQLQLRQQQAADEQEQQQQQPPQR